MHGPSVKPPADAQSYATPRLPVTAGGLPPLIGRVKPACPEVEHDAWPQGDCVHLGTQTAREAYTDVQLNQKQFNSTRLVGLKLWWRSRVGAWLIASLFARYWVAASHAKFPQSQWRLGLGAVPPRRRVRAAFPQGINRRREFWRSRGDPAEILCRARALS